MKFRLLCASMLMLMMTGCAVDINLYGVKYNDDAPVELNALVEARDSESVPWRGTARLDPALCRAPGCRRAQGCGRELADIFRLAWLESIFATWNTTRSDPGGSCNLRRLAQAKGANIS